MTNTMKRMLSGIMAMTMTCGISTISAFAANLDEASAQTFTAITDEIVMPTISVEVPFNATITIDPFNISGDGQITSTESTIINTGDVPLKATLVGVSAKPSDNSSVTIVTKALSDGSKWATLNIAVTDGLKKTTSKAISETVQDIAVSTAMAPLGGQVTFKFTGSCASNITAESVNDWDTEDKIETSLAYSFAAQEFTTYNITSLAFFSTDDITAVTIEDETVNNAPSTLSGNGGKVEVPVTWKVEDGKAVPKVSQASAAASNAVIYTLPEDLTAVTITPST